MISLKEVLINSDEKPIKLPHQCNNPMTKEPKLDRAMRIAPEWKEFDSKLKKILENVDSNSEYLDIFDIRI